MLRLLLTLLLVPISITCTAEHLVAKPVTVGGQENLDACMSLGVVSGLNPHGDGFLAVRSGTSSRHALLDKLYKGQYVYVCQTSTDGKWLGVVYSHDKDQDCGVSSPIYPAQVYSGACRSGWVYGRWIAIIAG